MGARPRAEIEHCFLVCVLAAGPRALGILCVNLFLFQFLSCLRMFDSSLWGRFFEALLNAHEPLSLPDVIKPLDTKLKTYRNFLFRNSIQRAYATLAKYQPRDK